MKKIILLGMIFMASTGLLGMACQKHSKPDPEKPDDLCDAVCSHYRQLGCEEGDPTPAGRSCESVCENLLDSTLPDVKEYYLKVLNGVSCE